MNEPASKPANWINHPLIPSWNFILYSIIGLSGVGIDYLSYAALLHIFDWNYLTANILSTSLGITNNFILNAVLNFKVRDRLLTRFLTFYGVGLLGLAVTMLLMWCQVELAGLPPLLAKLFTIFIVVLLQYNMNKKLSFRAARVESESHP